MAGFGFRAFQELEAGRGVEEDVPDRDGRPPGHAAGLHLPDPSPLGVDLGPLDRPLRPGGKGEAGNRGDRGKRLPPEPEGGELEEVGIARDLAGGVPLQGKKGVLAGHPAAVVGHPDEPLSPGLDLHRHLARACVEGVLHELLHHRGGAFHHLAGGNLVGQVFGENLDPRGHFLSPWDEEKQSLWLQRSEALQRADATPRQGIIDTITLPVLAVLVACVAVMVKLLPLVVPTGTVSTVVATPVGSVIADGRESDPPVVVKLTTAPMTGLPDVSTIFAVMFDVTALLRSAVALICCGVALTENSEPKVTVMVPGVAVPDEAETVTVPWMLLVRVTVAVPPVVDGVDVVVKLPLPEVMTNETTVPSATAAPLAFLTVAVMVTLPPTPGDKEDADKVMVAGALGFVSGNQSTPQPVIVTMSMAMSQNTLCMTPPSKVGAGLSARV